MVKNSAAVIHEQQYHPACTGSIVSHMTVGYIITLCHIHCKLVGLNLIRRLNLVSRLGLFLLEWQHFF